MENNIVTNLANSIEGLINQSASHIVADGEPISIQASLYNGTNAAIYIGDLSDIIPKDGYLYEIELFTSANKTSSGWASFYFTTSFYSDLSIAPKETQSLVTSYSVCNTMPYVRETFKCILGLDRQFCVQLDAAVNATIVELLSYRRLGKNK